MKPAAGSRVYAIVSATKDTVSFLGYGVYVGDEVPTAQGGGSFTGMMSEVGFPNPKIRLDNGDVVWGCECWWGPEDDFQRQFGARTIVPVRIADARKVAV